jgi:hypothetical protein
MMYDAICYTFQQKGPKKMNQVAEAALPTKNSQLTRIIISHGDKGGVGKSMVACALADFLLSTGEKVAIIDADTRNPDVDRMFSSHLPCAKINLRSEDGWIDFMEFIENHPGHSIVISTPSGIGEYMYEDIPRLSEFLKQLKFPAEMELWWTINRQTDSVNLLGDAYKSYGDAFTRIRVIANLYHAMGDKNAFTQWNESPLRPRLEKSGGMTLYFPELTHRVTDVLFQPDKIMPFSVAVDVALGESAGLSGAVLFRLKEWLKNVDACFRPAFTQSVAKQK